MAVIVPSLIEKLTIVGVATDPDGTLRDKTTLATDGSTSAGQTAGLIQVKLTTQYEGVKVTWDLGHGDLEDGDTVSIFIHSIGTFPPANGDILTCMPYITANTVNTTSSNWVNVDEIFDGAFNFFTFDAAFRAALVDLDGNGKFSVRIIIFDASPVSVKRFSRWNEVESELTPPGGGVIHQGDPDDMFGVATVDVFGGATKDSGVVEDPNGLFGTADVASQGGVRRDSGVAESPNGLFGTATVASQGGVIRDSGVAESPGGLFGIATVPLVVASFIRGGTSSMTGTATVLASGQKVGATVIEGNPEDMFGIATVVSEGGVTRGSGVVEDPDGLFGTATVASQGGVRRDSGTINSPDGLFGIATAASAGGVTRDSGVVSSPGGLVGAAVVAASGSKQDEPLIDGSTTRLLEDQFESITVISDGTQWWIM